MIVKSVVPFLLLLWTNYPALTDGLPVLSRSMRSVTYLANETACIVNNIVYYNSDPIPTENPCETCKCRPPGFACVLKECELKPGCKAIRKEGQCCPEYQCGCEHDGYYYKDGERIPSPDSPCYICSCQSTAITCALIDCHFRSDCEPNYLPGECCPRYDHCPPLPAEKQQEASTTQAPEPEGETPTETPIDSDGDDNAAETSPPSSKTTLAQTATTKEEEKETTTTPSQATTLEEKVGEDQQLHATTTKESLLEASTTTEVPKTENEAATNAEKYTSEPITTKQSVAYSSGNSAGAEEKQAQETISTESVETKAQEEQTTKEEQPATKPEDQSLASTEASLLSTDSPIKKEESSSPAAYGSEEVRETTKTDQADDKEQLPTDPKKPETLHKLPQLEAEISQEQSTETSHASPEQPAEVSQPQSEQPSETTQATEEKPAETVHSQLEQSSEKSKVSEEQPAESSQSQSEQPSETSQLSEEQPAESLQSQQPSETSQLSEQQPAESSQSQSEQPSEISQVSEEQPAESSQSQSEQPSETSQVSEKQPAESLHSQPPSEPSQVSEEQPAESSQSQSEQPSETSQVSEEQPAESLQSQPPSEPSQVSEEQPAESSQSQQPSETLHVTEEQHAESSQSQSQTPTETSQAALEQSAESLYTQSEQPTVKQQEQPEQPSETSQDHSEQSAESLHAQSEQPTVNQREQSEKPSETLQEHSKQPVENHEALPEQPPETTKAQAEQPVTTPQAYSEQSAAQGITSSVEKPSAETMQESQDVAASSATLASDDNESKLESQPSVYNQASDETSVTTIKDDTFSGSTDKTPMNLDKVAEESQGSVEIKTPEESNLSIVTTLTSKESSTERKLEATTANPPSAQPGESSTSEHDKEQASEYSYGEDKKYGITESRVSTLGSETTEASKVLVSEISESIETTQDSHNVNKSLVDESSESNVSESKAEEKIESYIPEASEAKELSQSTETSGSSEPQVTEKATSEQEAQTYSLTEGSAQALTTAEKEQNDDSSSIKPSIEKADQPSEIAEQSREASTSTQTQVTGNQPPYNASSNESLTGESQSSSYAEEAPLLADASKLEPSDELVTLAATSVTKEEHKAEELPLTTLKVTVEKTALIDGGTDKQSASEDAKVTTTASQDSVTESIASSTTAKMDQELIPDVASEASLLLSDDDKVAAGSDLKLVTECADDEKQMKHSEEQTEQPEPNTDHKVKDSIPLEKQKESSSTPESSTPLSVNTEEIPQRESEPSLDKSLKLSEQTADEVATPAAVQNKETNVEVTEVTTKDSSSQQELTMLANEERTTMASEILGELKEDASETKEKSVDVHYAGDLGDDPNKSIQDKEPENAEESSIPTTTPCSNSAEVKDEEPASESQSASITIIADKTEGAQETGQKEEVSIYAIESSPNRQGDLHDGQEEKKDSTEIQDKGTTVANLLIKNEEQALNNEQPAKEKETDSESEQSKSTKQHPSETVSEIIREMPKVTEGTTEGPKSTEFSRGPTEVRSIEIGSEEEIDIRKTNDVTTSVPSSSTPCSHENESKESSEDKIDREKDLALEATEHIEDSTKLPEPESLPSNVIMKEENSPSTPANLQTDTQTETIVTEAVSKEARQHQTELKAEHREAVTVSSDSTEQQKTDQAGNEYDESTEGKLAESDSTERVDKLSDDSKEESITEETIKLSSARPSVSAFLYASMPSSTVYVSEKGEQDYGIGLTLAQTKLPLEREPTTSKPVVSDQITTLVPNSKDFSTILEENAESTEEKPVYYTEKKEEDKPQMSQDANVSESKQQQISSDSVPSSSKSSLEENEVRPTLTERLESSSATTFKPLPLVYAELETKASQEKVELPAQSVESTGRTTREAETTTATEGFRTAISVVTSIAESA